MESAVGTNSIKEIARRVGVVPSTVSRALSGARGVSAARREEILRVARQIGYVPDLNARALKTGKTGAIAVIVEVAPTQMRGIRNHAIFARARTEFPDVRLVVHQPGEPLETTFRRAISGGAGAVIASGVNGRIGAAVSNEMRDRSIAAVVVDGRIPGIGSISIDRVAGTRRVVELFDRIGARNPVYFTRRRLGSPDARLAGIIEAHASSGRQVDKKSLVMIATAEAAEGYEIMKSLIRDRDVDAVFAYNDVMAIGAMRAIAEAGLTVGRDVSVVGFDDIPIAAFLPTPLTTVSQPVTECVDAAFAYLADARVAPVAIETTLIIRRSTR